MNRLITFLLAALPVIILSTSCTKTVTKTEIQRDTLQVAAKDTNFVMSVTDWDLVELQTLTLKSPNSATYLNTSEGIKFFGHTNRFGSRLQVKNEVGFKDKTIYYKWKVNNAGQYTDVVIGIKYVPLTGEGIPAIQGVDLQFYSLPNQFNNSIIVQPDTWYYTRIAAVKGTNDFQVKTATGNYDNKGGTTLASKTVPIYTKHGYPAIRLGDPHSGSNAYVVLGECKIADN